MAFGIIVRLVYVSPSSTIKHVRTLQITHRRGSCSVSDGDSIIVSIHWVFHDSHRKRSHQITCSTPKWDCISKRCSNGIVSTSKHTYWCSISFSFYVFLFIYCLRVCVCVFICISYWCTSLCVCECEFLWSHQHTILRHWNEHEVCTQHYRHIKHDSRRRNKSRSGNCIAFAHVYWKEDEARAHAREVNAVGDWAGSVGVPRAPEENLKSWQIALETISGW